MEEFSFSDDAPRLNPLTEDDFGYAPFSANLAKVLQKLEAPNGYVLGLHGAWGSGKTTALNFVKYYLDYPKETGEIPLEVLDFAPWMIAGHDVVSSFFRVLADRVNPRLSQVQRTRSAARNTLRASADPLFDALIAVASSTHPDGTLAFKAAGQVAKDYARRSIDTWLKEPTVQAAKAELVYQLRVSKRKFIVFIDDIDRLEPHEVKSIMQLVKSIGSLPNVIYLLSFDGRIVRQALAETALEASGEPTYLEKIVQHEIALPHISKTRLLKRLDREIEFVFASFSGGDRWHDIVQGGIRRWINRPRDVLRYANAVKFSWAAMGGKLDTADLLAMEALRTFHPKVHEWVLDSRPFLVDGAQYISEAQRVSHFRLFRESLDPRYRDEIVEFLCTMFPSKANSLREKEAFSWSEPWAETVSRRGVASPDGFDTYFEQSASPHIIPKSLLDQVSENLDDEEVQRGGVRFALDTKDESGASLIGEYLQELQYRLAARPSFKPGAAVFNALLEAGEVVQFHEKGGNTFMPPHSTLQILLRDILERLGNERASEVIGTVVENCDSAPFLASFYVWRAREAGLLPAEGAKTGRLISDDALNLLGAHTLARIKAEAADGSIMRAAFYWDLATALLLLDGDKAAKELMRGVAQTDAHTFAKLALGTLSYSYSGGERHYFYRGLGADRSFYEPSVLLAAASTFAGAGDLSHDERARIVALRDGLLEEHSLGGSEAS